MSQKGLDVSEFQGTIDWTQVQSAGYQFAMLRAGYGFGTVDRQFHRNAAECNRLGIPVGAYWFCYAISTVSLIIRKISMIRDISLISTSANTSKSKTVMVITSVHLEYERERHQAAGPNPYL